MQDKFNQWLSQVDGKPIEVEDSSALDQCMDLAFSWCDFIGIPHSIIAHPFAYEVWANPTDTEVAKFAFIPNTPNGIPQVGDIIVFNQKIGSAGHISIATGEGDINTFTSEDQNWGGKLFAQKVTHTYTDVYGFLRPKVTVEVPPVTPVITDQTLLDTISDGKIEYQALKSLTEDRKNALSTSQNQVTALTAKNDEYVKQVGDDAIKIGSLQSELDAIKNQPGTTTVVVHESFIDWLKSLLKKSA